MNEVLQIGNHRLTNRNVLFGLDDLMNGVQADIGIVDPPWGAGNEKYWHTMLKKDDPTTEIIRPMHDEFLSGLLELLYRHTKNVCIIEYGVRWRDEVKEYAAQAGFDHLAVVQTRYGTPKKLYPLDYHIISKQRVSLPQDYLSNISNLVGFTASKAALKPFAKEGGILLDPCCGLGGYGKLAVELNMRFHGNEMNPKRFQRTVDVLHRVSR